MTKVFIERRSHPRTFLYARILIWITIPLFFLGVFFTALQLTQQITTLNKINRIQSEIAFKGVYKFLKPEFQKEENFSDLASFKKSFAELKQNYGIYQLDAYDVLGNKPLFGRSKSTWTAQDIQAIGEIIPNYKIGSPYEIRLNKNLKQMIAYLVFQGPDLEALYVTKVAFPLTDVKTAMQASRKTLAVLFAALLMIGFIISQGLANAIIRPLKLLDKATREIRSGALGSHVEIKTGDEIEALAYTFNQMSDALEDITRRAQDSNPLTGLPGNTGIFNNLEKRIRDRQKLVLFHCDLDRFKVFNDRFGLAQGDKAIKLTAAVLKKAVADKGGSDDFVGHQGGDDFVVITRPQRAAELAAYICEIFKTTVVKQLYSKEDYENGYVLQNDRRRQTETGEVVMIKFPLISISLAGISNEQRDFADYTDCMNRVAPVKKEAKKIIESNFIIHQ